MQKNVRFYLVILAIILVGAGVFLITYGLPATKEATPLIIRFSAQGVQLEYAGHHAALGEALEGIKTESLEGNEHRVSFGAVSILFTQSDTPSEAPATVLVLNGTELNQAALKAINPAFAVFNTDSAPIEAALRLLDGTCRRVLRRDLQGEITLHTDGAAVWFFTEKEASSEEIFPYRKNLALEAIQFDYSYVLNQNSKIFHLPTCPSVEQMKEENKQFSSESRETLLALGYRPCSSCQP